MSKVTKDSAGSKEPKKPAQVKEKPTLKEDPITVTEPVIAPNKLFSTTIVIGSTEA